MINIANDLIGLFQTILIMSGCAALLCGAILLVKAIVGRRMSARSHALVWLALIPALVVPFSLFSLPTAGFTAKSAEVWAPIRQMIGHLAAEPIATLSEENTDPRTTSTESTSDPNETISRNQPGGSSSIGSLNIKLTTGQTIWLISSLMWLIGLMMFLVIYISGYKKTRRMIEVTANPAMKHWQERLHHLSDESMLRNPARVQLNWMDSNRSPFVIGLTRSSIMLPACLLDQEDTDLMDAVLIHELIHIKHFDHGLRLLQCLLLCIHWFNPLCWLAFRLQQRDCEFYCDETAVRQLKDHDRTAYAQALLATAVCWTNAKKSPHVDRLLTASFAEDNLRDRITHVLRKNRTSRWTAVSVVFFIVLAGYFLLPAMIGTSANSDPTPTPSPSSNATTPTASPSPTPTIAATAAPTPTASPAVLHDPELSAKEFELIGIGISRIDIIEMYYEGSNIRDYRDLPVPAEFALEGGGAVAFEYTMQKEDASAAEARVFVTKMTIRDASGTRTVAADPNVVPIKDFQIQKEDFILPVGPDPDQTISYTALIDALSEPLEKSIGDWEEEGYATDMRYMRLTYEGAELLFLQRKDTAQTDIWTCKQVHVISDAFVAPGGIRCGMGMKEVMQSVGKGQLHYSPLYNWTENGWSIEPVVQSDDGFFIEMVLNWTEDGKVSEFFIFLSGGDFGGGG